MIENILKKLENEENTYKDVESLKESVECFNQYYVNSCNTMIESNRHVGRHTADLTSKLKHDTFTKTSKILFEI